MSPLGISFKFWPWYGMAGRGTATNNGHKNGLKEWWSFGSVDGRSVGIFLCKDVFDKNFNSIDEEYLPGVRRGRIVVKKLLKQCARIFLYSIRGSFNRSRHSASQWSAEEVIIYLTHSTRRLWPLLSSSSCNGSSSSGHMKTVAVQRVHKMQCRHSLKEAKRRMGLVFTSFVEFKGIAIVHVPPSTSPPSANKHNFAIIVSLNGKVHWIFL